MEMHSFAYGLLVVSAAAAAAFAQDVTGGVTGTVLDPQAAAVPHANVILRDTGHNQVVRTLTTDILGKYAAPLLPGGSYAITVEAPGFKLETVNGIEVTPGSELKIDIKLEVGSPSESVTVADQPADLEMTATLTDTLGGAMIRQMSLATRNYQELLSLLPGVTSDQVDELYLGISNPSGSAAATPYSVNGQRSNAANFLIDGADNVDRSSNSTVVSYPSVDSIDTLVILAGLYSADSGRSAGAQVNAISRRGLSQFHGSAFEYLRNNFFEANSYLNNANRIPVPEVRWNDFGGNLGGPPPAAVQLDAESHLLFLFQRVQPDHQLP